MEHGIGRPDPRLENHQFVRGRRRCWSLPFKVMWPGWARPSPSWGPFRWWPAPTV